LEPSGNSDFTTLTTYHHIHIPYHYTVHMTYVSMDKTSSRPNTTQGPRTSPGKRIATMHWIKTGYGTSRFCTDGLRSCSVQVLWKDWTCKRILLPTYTISDTVHKTYVSRGACQCGPAKSGTWLSGSAASAPPKRLPSASFSSKKWSGNGARGDPPLSGSSNSSYRLILLPIHTISSMLSI
jgi:hypothetical protein